MQRSDSLSGHLPSLSLRLVRHTRIPSDWSSARSARTELQGLTGCLADIMCSANGPTTPGLRPLLADNASVRCCFQRGRALEQDPEVTKISGLTPFTAGAASPQSIHPHYLSVYASTKPTSNGKTAYTHAATLDTGLVANDLPRRDSHPLVNKPFPVRSGRAVWKNWARQ